MSTTSGRSRAAAATASADPRLSPEGPTTAIDSGRQAAVPLMIGVNSGEDSLLDYGGGLAKAKAAALEAVPGGTVFLPDREIALADFFIDRYEVTNRAFKRFIDAGGYRSRDY